MSRVAARRRCQVRRSVTESAGHFAAFLRSGEQGRQQRGLRPALRGAYAVAKPNRPTREVRMRPTKSAIRPPAGRFPNASVYAVITHWRPSSNTPSPRWAESRAMFTIVASKDTIGCARAITPRGPPPIRIRRQFVGSGVGGGRSSGGVSHRHSCAQSG